MLIPKNYKKNARTKLLYLYKIGYIKEKNFLRCLKLL